MQGNTLCMHWKKNAICRGGLQDTWGKGRDLEACNMLERVQPSSSNEGKKEFHGRDNGWRTWEPSTEVWTEDGLIPNFPNHLCSQNLFPLMLSRFQHRGLGTKEPQLWLGEWWAKAKDTVGSHYMPSVKPWKGPALWNQVNLVSIPDSSTCYLYRFGQIT